MDSSGTTAQDSLFAARRRSLYARYGAAGYDLAWRILEDRTAVETCLHRTFDKVAQEEILPDRITFLRQLRRICLQACDKSDLTIWPDAVCVKGANEENETCLRLLIGRYWFFYTDRQLCFSYGIPDRESLERRMAEGISLLRKNESCSACQEPANELLAAAEIPPDVLNGTRDLFWKPEPLTVDPPAESAVPEKPAAMQEVVARQKEKDEKEKAVPRSLPDAILNLVTRTRWLLPVLTGLALAILAGNVTLLLLVLTDTV